MTDDVARPLSYKTKTIYCFQNQTPARSRPRPLFQDQDRFFKDHQIINSRPQINVPLQNKIRPVMPVLHSHAEIMPVTEKKPAYYRLSSQVLLRPKLGS